ncbi:MAG: Flp family type IVb pilin [Pseudomonadota bacterium]
MAKFFADFLKDEDGATAIEYGLIAALIGIGIIVAARALGTEISATFSYIQTQLDGATP